MRNIQTSMVFLSNGGQYRVLGMSFKEARGVWMNAVDCEYEYINFPSESDPEICIRTKEIVAVMASVPVEEVQQ